MSVPAASRTLDLIEAFARERRPMTVSALSKAMGVPISSCHGLVKTLEERGYLIEMRDQGGYYFTKLLTQQASRIGGYDPLPAWTIPALAAIRDECNETVVLAKLSDGVATYIEVMESEQSVRYIVKVGDSRPLYASAVGKALLTAFPENKRTEMIDRMELVRHSSATLVSKAALNEDLKKSAARGWSMTQGEFFEDVDAVAVPVVLGGQYYACGIAGPSSRMRGNVAAHVKLLKSFGENR
jgi:IclR family acetate operon transcriptional repressor